MKSDEFLPIRGFPDYFVNEHGDVLSTKNGREMLIKPHEDKDGYLFVNIYDADGRPRMKKIHRLLAEAFIDNPCDYPLVCHADDNKQNNSLSNLRWGTNKSNADDMIRNGHSTRREVYCYETKKVYASIRMASTELGVHPSDIVACAKGNISHSKGYHFAYADETIDQDRHFFFKQRPHRHGAITAINTLTGEVRHFDSQKEAASELDLKAPNISMCLSGTLKSCKHWKFEYDQLEG